MTRRPRYPESCLTDKSDKSDNAGIGVSCSLGPDIVRQGNTADFTSFRKIDAARKLRFVLVDPNGPMFIAAPEQTRGEISPIIPDILGKALELPSNRVH